MIHYILQVILFQLLFLVVYDVFLKKETFFNYNRLYLLGTAVLSFVIPFLKIGAIQQIIPQEFRVQLPAVLIGNTAEATPNASVLLDEVIVTQQSVPWSIIAIGIYLLGMLLSIIFFTLKLRKLFLLKKTAKLEKSNKYTIAIVPNSDVAFTFLNTIFLGDQLTEPQKGNILQHELVHVQQRHTLDLLFFELLRILFWFNPMVYIFQHKIQTLHEYTADRLVASKDKAGYYQNLLSEVFGTTKISFINTFYKSSIIKNRIVMLQKSKSKKIVQLKYLLLIPAVCAMLFYTSCANDTSVENEEPDLAQYTYSLEMGEEMSPETKVVHDSYEAFLRANNRDYVAWASTEGNVITYSVHAIDEKVPETFSKDLKVKSPDGASYTMYMQFPDGKGAKLEDVSVEYRSIDDYLKDPDAVNKSYTINHENSKGVTTIQKLNDPNIEPVVPFSVIEKAPTYPGCTGANNEAMKSCMATKIQQLVMENFNTKIAENLNLSGRQRISVQFKIDKTGNVVNVRARAPHPDLETEAVRVVSKLPKMIPGEQDGKKVNVIYALPIVFEINE